MSLVSLLLPGIRLVSQACAPAAYAVALACVRCGQVWWSAWPPVRPELWCPGCGGALYLAGWWNLATQASPSPRSRHGR